MTAYDSSLKSPANAKALGAHKGAQPRAQEVLSPSWIIDAARTALGGTIDVDPCASTDPAAWFATHNITLPIEAIALEKRLLRVGKQKSEKARAEAKRLKALLKPYYLCGGIDSDWGKGAYVNMPFGFLRPWMERIQRAGDHTPVVALSPVRTHRPWWVRALKGSEVVWLDYDVVFEGHQHTFPGPLCLAAWNCTIPDLGKRETGRWRP